MPQHHSWGMAHILVIDDAESERRAVADVLGGVPYKVTFAADGEQGYQLAIVDKPDLILLDVRMPRMDGHTCCRLLKANEVTRTIPIIFLSVLNRPEDRILGLSLGAVDFVSKPFHPAELLARIRIHLNLVQRDKATPVSRFDVRAADLETVIVEAARQLILANLATLPGLTEIAHAIGTHRERLNELFRKHTGNTVFAFIREERYNRGMQLLCDTDLDIRDIARLVGFNSAANFATAFRARTGMTPSTFRHVQAEKAAVSRTVVPGERE